MNILVSACLLGVKCRYNGTDAYLQGLQKLKEKHTLISVCPELLGGLPTPRPPAERCGDAVLTKEGADVTDAFVAGPEKTLKLAKQYGCSVAILKERSPSCGYGKIYDGTFCGRLINGSGITAELLEQNGVKILRESGVADYFR